MSALVTIKCPCSNCNQRIEYPPDMCGQQITCPHCQQATVLLAPQISPEALKAAPVPAAPPSGAGGPPTPQIDASRQTVRIDKSALVPAPPGPGGAPPPPSGGGAPPPPPVGGGAPPPPSGGGAPPPPPPSGSVAPPLPPAGGDKPAKDDPYATVTDPYATMVSNEPPPSKQEGTAPPPAGGAPPPPPPS